MLSTYSIISILDTVIYNSRVFCDFTCHDVSIATVLIPLGLHILREFDFQ